MGIVLTGSSPGATSVCHRLQAASLDIRSAHRRYRDGGKSELGLGFPAAHTELHRKPVALLSTCPRPAGVGALLTLIKTE